MRRIGVVGERMDGHQLAPRKTAYCRLACAMRKQPQGLHSKFSALVLSCSLSSRPGLFPNFFPANIFARLIFQAGPYRDSAAGVVYVTPSHSH